MIVLPPPSSVPELRYRKYLAALFANGEQGGLYLLNKSDQAKLFQDVARTSQITAFEQYVAALTDLSGNGNHFSQATSTARGAWSARVNLLTKTEDFSDAAWSKAGASATSATITEDSTSGLHGAYQLLSNPAMLLSASVILKAGSRSFAQLQLLTDLAGTPSRYGVVINLTSGAVASTATVGSPTGVSVSVQREGLDEWLVTTTSNQTVAGSAAMFGYLSDTGTPTLSNAAPSYTGNGAGNIFARNAQLRPAAQSYLPYQRVNTPTDYDSVGFPPYLLPDGADDCYTSASGGGSTTGIFFSGAFTPLLAGSKQVIWSDASGNTGYEICINASNQFEISAGTGAARVTCVSAALTVGTPKVLTAAHDGTTLTVRVDGVATTAACGAASAGTAGTTFLRTNGAASAYAKVRCNGFVQRQGAQPSADMRALVERYMAAIQGRSL